MSTRIYFAQTAIKESTLLFIIYFLLGISACSIFIKYFFIKILDIYFFACIMLIVIKDKQKAEDTKNETGIN